jgi:UDP-N-acetyl-D-galactosamine dehydrogenase
VFKIYKYINEESELMENELSEHLVIIGLGYVGLPLAIEFAKKYKVTGCDINQQRIDELLLSKDHTLEASEHDLKAVLRKKGDDKGLYLTTGLDTLENYSTFIITVPTPVDSFNVPDLTPLLKATEAISKFLKKGNVIIYESTVYPGCTEEVCVPIIEKVSGLNFNSEFYCGYSPERINPGDKEHTLTKIKKITSGSTPAIAEQIDQLYSSIIVAGTHSAPSIKVAEAAKAIENAQRDINIAFVNELAKIFNLLDIDSNDVFEAAGTKWNFLPFKPGLVGGHCIGVDPYYLAQKAQSVGYHPEIILAGRRVNDSMGAHIADQVTKLMVKKEIIVQGADVLVLGITFKENCTDVRNTKVIDIVRQFHSWGSNVTVFDPWASCEEVKHEYNIVCTDKLPEKKYDVVILAVNHQEFLLLNFDSLMKDKSVLYDVKGNLDKASVDGRL